ncbi:hypothetical protein OsI_28339 [Oryza sativa Indica Group]|uniref:Uncharacterized protein n=1 Tax=Oryza sativa subsp. indica TaxID=39946 RepID=A2YSP1_ORYSI|nr:hypothetical protein OsI_28339 [Oryza sativa Indica Group]
MAALPDVRRQAASCRCTISAPGGPASIGSSLCDISDGCRKLQLRSDRRRPRRRASVESSQLSEDVNTGIPNEAIRSAMGSFGCRQPLRLS